MASRPGGGEGRTECSAKTPSTIAAAGEHTSMKSAARAVVATVRLRDLAALPPPLIPGTETVPREIKRLEEELAEHWQKLNKQEEALRRAKRSSPPSSLSEKGADTVQTRDFVRGLKLYDAVLAGMVHGLGLEDANDPTDVAAPLRALTSADVEALFMQHFVPRLTALFMKSVDELSTDGREDVASANSRYADEDFGRRAKLGNIDVFEKGFTSFNGKPRPDDVLAQMHSEFANDEEFETSNYGGIKTTLRTEWEYAVAPVEGKEYPGEKGLKKGDGTFHPGRNRKQISTLMKLATSVQAKLGLEEVIAVRLYTGPAFMRINKGLREGGLEAKKLAIENFPATCAAFNSAIKKLRLVTELPKARKLFRGITMALPQEVLDAESFVEFAYTSATPNYEVAKGYAGTAKPSLFEIEVGKIDRGAFIGEYSQYEAEEEHVLAPLSHYEIVGKRREEGINVYSLRLNVNGKMETLEELREDRKTKALEVAQKLNVDCLQLTGHDSLQVSRIVETDIEPVGYEWFNQGRNFTQVLGKLEETLVRELEEEAEMMRKSAEALPQEQKVAKLRKCTKLIQRCSAGDADGNRSVLQVQERLVDVIKPMIKAPGLQVSMASTSAAADDLVDLADMLDKMSNDYPRALDMLEQALTVKKALDPPAPPTEVARILERQGKVLTKLSQLDDALGRYEEAKTVWVKDLGHEAHLDVAVCYFGIANVCLKQSKFDKALEFYRKDLEITIALVGEDHLGVAKTYTGMANVYEKQGNFEQALEYHELSLKIKIKLLGSSSHPEVAKSHHNIGVVYGEAADRLGSVTQKLQKFEKFEKALEHLETGLRIRRKIHGDKHLDVAASYNGLGNVYEKQGKLDEAFEQLRMSLEIKRQIFGGDKHPDVAKSLNNMAMVYEKQKQSDHALDHYEKALQIFLDVYGAKHREVANVKHNLAWLLKDRKEVEKARQLFSETEQIYMEIYGPGHRETLKAAELAKKCV